MKFSTTVRFYDKQVGKGESLGGFREAPPGFWICGHEMPIFRERSSKRNSTPAYREPMTLSTLYIIEFWTG